eukprot:2037055-Amphidinium_carterae.1
MNRVRALGLAAHAKARAAKSLGLYGAEVGAMMPQAMQHIRTSALGKGAQLRRSASLELMAGGGLNAWKPALPRLLTAA